MLSKERIRMTFRCFLLVGLGAAVLAGCENRNAETERMVPDAERASDWVRAGQPVAVVVVSDSAEPIAVYAADELVLHIEKATGARLDVVEESRVPAEAETRIFVGSTTAARHVGIAPNSLPSEKAVVRIEPGAAYIVGRDGPGHPLDEFNPNSGTLWGVYEFLEREMGVRWIWPGRGRRARDSA